MVHQLPESEGVMKDLGVFATIILFFLAIFFLFKQALVTAAAIMGFSILWYIISIVCHKLELAAVVDKAMVDYEAERLKKILSIDKS